MSISIHDDITNDVTFYAEENAPWAISLLIRSKEDALIIHRVLRGHVETTRGVGKCQCDKMGEILDKWDSPEFSISNAEEITRLASELRVRYDQEHDPEIDGREYGVVCAVLESLIMAATSHATTLERQRGCHAEVPMTSEV